MKKYTIAIIIFCISMIMNLVSSVAPKPVKKVFGKQTSVPTVVTNSAPVTATTPIGKNKKVFGKPKLTSVKTLPVSNVQPVSIPSLSSITTASSSIPNTTSNQSVDPAISATIEQFFSVFPDPTIPTNALLPSLSKAVDLVYNKTLHLPPVLLTAITKFYAFLQGQICDLKLSNQQAILSALQQKIDIAILKNDPLLSSLQSQFKKAQNDYQLQKNSLDNSIIKLCCESSVWQHYLESIIALSFDYEKFLLSNIHDEEKEIFSFIPTYELSYHTDAFTQLRVNSEIVRVFLILTEVLRDRALEQSIMWKSIKDTSTLYDAIQAFKNTPQYITEKSFNESLFDTTLYPLPSGISIMDTTGTIAPGFKKFFHSLKNSDGTYSLIPNSNVQQMITVDTKGVVSLTSFGSLLIQYQPAHDIQGPSLQYTDMYYTLFQEGPSGFVPTPLYMTMLCSAGIKLLNQSLQYLFNTANLESTMAQLATLDPFYFIQFPMIISYQPSDYLYLDDINFLKSGTKSAASSSANQGIAQPQGHGFVNAMKKVGNGIVSAAKVVGHAIEKNAISLGNSIVTAGEKFVSGISNAGKAIGNEFVNIGKDIVYSVSNLAQAAYYDSGLACLTEGISYSAAQGKASHLIANTIHNVTDIFTQCYKMIDSLGQIVITAVNLVGSVAGQTVGFLLGGGKLGDDISGFINTVADDAIKMLISATEFTFSLISTPIELTIEAVLFLGQAITELVTAPFIAAAGGTPFAGMSNLGGEFLLSIVTSLLRPVTFIFNFLKAAMDMLIQGTAYLAGAILDLVINIAGGVSALAAATYGGDMAAAFNHISNSVNEHRRVIIESITITLMVIAGFVAVPFTGGGSIGYVVAGVMGVIGAGMMSMAAVGDNFHDQEAIKNKAKQKTFLVAYQQYVTDNVITTSRTEDLLINDVNNQFTDTLMNQERSLLYYQNYLNNSINSSIQTAAYGLGSFYNQMLTPDSSSGLLLADPGAVYGIQTNRMTVNPSQGITLYNMQRNSFAQEVACMPTQVITDNQNNSVPIKDSPSQFWINQKDLSNIDLGKPLITEVRWRTLYESQGAFYIGIFLSNQYLDKAALNALYANIKTLQNSTDLNADTLLEKAWKNLTDVNMHMLNFNNKGKAFVIFRETLSSVPTLGFYEHQGAGWINKNITPINYQTGVWFRMKFQIAGTSALVKCWAETDFEPAGWQGTYPISMDPQFTYPAPIPLGTTITPSELSQNIGMITESGLGKKAYDTTQKQWVPYSSPAQPTTQPVFAGSMGVITSGAAVEYQVITPATSVVVTQARKQSDTTITNQLKNQGLLTTEIDQEKSYLSKSTQPIGPITFGSFTLTPVSQALINQGVYIYTTNQTGLSNNGIDYVVFATSVSQNDMGVGTASGLGVSSNSNPQAVVSLVTGNAYDQTKKVIQSCNGVLAICQNSLGLPISLIQTITTANTQYYRSLTTTVTFANIALTGELGAIQNGAYVYSGPSINKNLTGKDYFVAATIQSSGLVTPAHAYGQKLDSANSAINGLISLVTGQVFTYTVANKAVASLVGQTLSKVTITPVIGAPVYSSLVSNYQSLLSSSLYQAIQQQNTAYIAAQTAAQVAVQTPSKPGTVTPPPVSKPTLSSLTSPTLSMPSMVNGPAVQNINDAIVTGGF